jgi:uncharacterized membrane protein
MHLKFSLILNTPRDEAWRAFDNVDNLQRWQPALTEYAPLSGKSGQPGATARLVYREAGHRIELVETVTSRREPSEFNASYESSHGRNTLHNRFEEIGDGQTRWNLEAEFSFKGAARLMAPMLRGTIEKRIRSDAERFKSLLEAGELQT